MPYKSIEQERAHRKERYWRDPEKARGDTRRWKRNNPDKAAASHRVWYEKHKEDRSAYYREWRERNKERKAAQDKEYRLRHAERLRRLWRKRYLLHKAEIRERQRQWGEKNRERLARKATFLYHEHHEERLEKQRIWRLYNVEQHRLNAKLRRARQRGAEGVHTLKDIECIWKSQGEKCNVPGCKLAIAASGQNKYHIDHIIALVNGGSNWPENLQILCRTHNMRKHTMDFDVWMERIRIEMSAAV